MNILVTGSAGFIGQNLIVQLKQNKENNILEFDKENTYDELIKYISKSDIIYHLAGINRPEDPKEFYEGNSNLTKTICDEVTKTGRNIPLVISSSIQAVRENDYGKSKLLAENYVKEYAEKTGNNCYIYRLPNVFGKWCKPNYNSAVATFCHNLANDLPITVNDENYVMNLVYIDDVVKEFEQLLYNSKETKSIYKEVDEIYEIKLGEIVELIKSYIDSRNNRMTPNITSLFSKKLYSTFLSYLPKDKFSYELKMNVDYRGSFTEFIKTENQGQVSVNISKPGITKGNHWHHTKNEKFLVVYGEGVIRFRDIRTSEVLEYFVSGNKLEVVDIPVGYTHNIENLGKTDMITVMWANELFDPENPDTIYEEV